MAEPLVHVERHDAVAVLRLDNGKVNALSVAVLEQLTEAVEALEADLPGALVVTGGDRVFAAGADINEFSGQEAARRSAAAFRQAFDAVERFPRVVVASIAGYALGGGLELALACDIRIASEKASLGLPEILLGIIPGAGGTQRLPRLIGPARARRLILTGRHVPAAEALEIGLVDEVVPADELWSRSLAVAAELARGPLVAQSLAKRAIREGLDRPLAEALDLEGELFVEVFGTRDAHIGIESFKENGPGKAEFTGS